MGFLIFLLGLSIGYFLYALVDYSVTKATPVHLLRIVYNWFNIDYVYATYNGQVRIYRVHKISGERYISQSSDFYLLKPDGAFKVNGNLKINRIYLDEPMHWW